MVVHDTIVPYLMKFMKNDTNLILSILLLAMGATTATAGYLGASAGYIVDGGGDKIFAVQSGTAFAESDFGSHNFELELAYWDTSESQTDVIGGISVRSEGDMEIIPVMANYLLKSKASRDLGFYGGVGLGYSFYDISAIARASGLSVSFSDSGGAFTWQLMIGLQYAFSPAASLKLGYRFVSMEDLSIIVGEVLVDDTSYAIEQVSFGGSGDESIIEAGFIFRF